MRQERRKILARVFVALLIFLIGVVIYKQGNPYAYPGLENRILFVLVPSGIVLLYLYLEEKETRNRLFSVIMVTIGRLHESKFMRFCEGIWESNWESNWERSPSLIHTRVSKVLVVLHPYLHKMSGYMLKQDPKQVVSYAFLGMLLIAALQSVIPQPPLEWARTPVMIAAVALGVVTFYLNKDELGEIEEEARQEKLEENLREMEFGEKYPRINRVWGVRWVVKWMYKEGWWYSGILLLIVFIGVGLRVWNLFKISYNLDEGIYYILFKNFENGALLPTLDSGGLYLRNFIYTYTSYFFNLFIDETLLSVRLVSLTFGISLLFLVYFFSKKTFNKKTALFGTFLATINPYLIVYSIQGRHYIMMLFFYFLFIYFVMFFNCESKRTKFSFIIIALIIGLNFEFVFLLTPILLLKYIRTENVFFIKICLMITILFLVQFCILSKIDPFGLIGFEFPETVGKKIINTAVLNEITISRGLSKFFFITLSFVLPIILLIFLNYKRLSQYFILNEKHQYLLFIFLVEAIFFSIFLERNQIRYRQTFLLMSLMIFLYIYYKSITRESIKKIINVSLIVLVLYLIIPVNVNYPPTINYEENKYINNYELLGMIFTDPLGFSSISANGVITDYASIEKMIDKKAIIITTDLYNLDPYVKIDYILNEYMMDWSSYIYDGKKLSKYNNIQFIDLNDLKDLANTNNKIQIIADSRFDSHLSTESKKYISDNFILIAETESSNIGQINRISKNNIRIYQFN